MLSPLTYKSNDAGQHQSKLQLYLGYNLISEPHRQPVERRAESSSTRGLYMMLPKT